MLPHPTHDRLIALGLVGMAKAFEEHRQQPAVASLTFEERLGLLVDREAVERESRRLVTRLKFANLRQNATIEDLNTKAARGLDKALFAKPNFDTIVMKAVRFQQCTAARRVVSTTKRRWRMPSSLS